MTPPAAAAAPARVARPRTAPARPPRRVSGPAHPARSTRPPRARTSQPQPQAEGGLALGVLAAGRALSQRRLLRVSGRTWIALVAFALIGIVALQLLVLKLNANIGRVLEREAALQRENAALSIEGSELVAGGRVESRAQTLGMQLVPVGSLRFLTVHPRADARHAASALASASTATASTTPSVGQTETSEGSGGETSEHTQTSEASTASAEATGATTATQAGSDEAGHSETTSAEAPATSGAAPAASTPTAQGGGEATTDAAGGTGPAGAE